MGTRHRFDEFRRGITEASAEKPRPAYGVDSCMRMVRLYCTADPAVFGNEGRWNLQIFAPLKPANGRDGKTRVISTASMAPSDLIALRDACNRALVGFSAYVRRGKPAKRAARSKR